MLVKGKGIIGGSEEFHVEHTEAAERLLYYVTGCGVYFCDYGYRVESEDYGNYMMLYVSKGILAISVGGRTYLVKEGQVAFFDCHVHHEYYSKGFASFLWVHFDGKNVGELYQEYYLRRNGIVYEGSQTEKLRKNISCLVSCYQNEMKINEVANSKLLYASICTLVFSEENIGGENQSNNVVNMAKDYIQKNLGMDLTLDVVADEVGLSASHFSRIFKKETSYSPYEYIIMARINRAKHLLKTTDKTIKEIAFEVGYRSESNFSNAFAKRLGVAPINYRSYGSKSINF